MKRIGFVVSLLVHVFFLAFLVRVQFPVKIYPSKPKVVDVIAMFPPLRGKLPPGADVPVVVKPFFLPAQPGGDRGTGLPDRGAGQRPSQSPPGKRSAAAAQRSRPLSGAATKGDRPVPEESDQSIASTGLVIDWKKISAQLNDRKTAHRPPPFSDDSLGITALPFEDAFPGGQSGDGEGSGSGAGYPGSPVSAYGGSAFFDSGGYDITPWAKRVVYRIKQNWIPPVPQTFGFKGRVDIYLVVEKNGQLRIVNLKKSSGIRSFDQAALNALRLSSPFLPLPGDFPNADLPAYLIFKYN